MFFPSYLPDKIDRSNGASEGAVQPKSDHGFNFQSSMNNPVNSSLLIAQTKALMGMYPASSNSQSNYSPISPNIAILNAQSSAAYAASLASIANDLALAEWSKRRLENSHAFQQPNSISKLDPPLTSNASFSLTLETSQPLINLHCSNETAFHLPKNRRYQPYSKTLSMKDKKKYAFYSQASTSKSESMTSKWCAMHGRIAWYIYRDQIVKASQILQSTNQYPQNISTSHSAFSQKNSLTKIHPIVSTTSINFKPSSLRPPFSPYLPNISSLPPSSYPPVPFPSQPKCLEFPHYSPDLIQTAESSIISQHIISNQSSSSLSLNSSTKSLPPDFNHSHFFNWMNNMELMKQYRENDLHDLQTYKMHQIMAWNSYLAHSSQNQIHPNFHPVHSISVPPWNQHSVDASVKVSGRNADGELKQHHFKETQSTAPDSTVVNTVSSPCLIPILTVDCSNKT